MNAISASSKPGAARFGLYLKAAYAAFFLSLLGLLDYGRTYYFAPSIKKVRLPLHPVLRQSGSLGHLLGIIGTAFMLLLLLYSARKRLRCMRNLGNLGAWLEVHIFLGLAGPFLVLFHANFRSSGIVSYSFWSMILVVASGIIGRYIYQMIPRSMSGVELSQIELEAEEIGLTYEIRKWLPREHPFWSALADVARDGANGRGAGFPFRFLGPIKGRLRLDRSLKNVESLSFRDRRKLLRLILKRGRLMRRKRLLDKSQRILHYWHLLHIPFVIILFLVLSIHVYVSWKMGARWIF